MLYTSVLYLLSYLIVCYAGVAPFIKPCKIDDQACMLSSAQAAIPFFAAGIKDLGVDALEPLVLDEYNADADGLKISLRQLKVTGIGKCKFTALEVEKFTSLSFDVECPIDATGKYTAEGMVLVKIEGDGDFEIKIGNVRLSLKAKLKTVDGTDGKKHCHIESYEYEYELLEKVHYNFKNLFNGKEELAKPVLALINENGKEFLKTFGQPIINEVLEKGKISIDQFLLAVPQNELYFE